MNEPYFGNADNRLKEVLSDFEGKIAVLVDENTAEHCLPIIEQTLPDKYTLIRIPSGELNKTLSTCDHVWKKLTGDVFHRSDLFINLGGGVIGDLGGFCAATYKRGIRFITIPTTLLSQVDASIGGKLGVDFGGFKNQIGVFKIPDEVIIDQRFLQTLPERELKSGFAEVIKHCLIHDSQNWKYLFSQSWETLDWSMLIPASIKVKSEIVEADFSETGLRKILNFGHTIGHGIESYRLESSEPLLHGEAIAAGMIMESWISTKVLDLPESQLNEIRMLILDTFEKVHFSQNEIRSVIKLIGMDKKNKGNKVLMTLLREIGSADYDLVVNEQLIEQSFDYYNSF